MSVGIVLFTRDLRVRDQCALIAATTEHGVAGTGVDTRPKRLFNALAQARRHDPNGDYVRRYVPELTELPGAAVHEPWRAPLARVAPEYPEPLAGAA